MTVNTLRYSEALQEAGVSRDQARVHANALQEAVEINVATKGDVAELKGEIKTDIANLKTWVFGVLIAQVLAITIGIAGILVALGKP